MKYIKKFNEVKIFGRKMDRNKFASIEDINSGHEIPILKKEYEYRKNLIKNLLSSFKKVYNTYIEDKIDFAANKLNLGVFDFDIQTKGKRFIKKDDENTAKKFIIDFWTEFQKETIDFDKDINEYNFQKIVAILWKYRNFINSNNQIEINKCCNEILHFLHNEGLDKFLYSGIKVGDESTDSFRDDFDELMDKYKSYDKSVEFVIDEDDNRVIFYIPIH